jgi:hypothetical protein
MVNPIRFNTTITASTVSILIEANIFDILVRNHSNPLPDLLNSPTSVLRN